MIELLRHIHFAHPKAFFLLVIPALMVVYYALFYHKSYASFKISSLKGVADMAVNWKIILKQWLFLFRIISLCLLITALARPQTAMKEQNITTEGIDIVISLDISGSMLARDFQPDRLEAAKKLSIEFVEGRPNDRIGFVVFAGESFTQCPITIDHAVLKKSIAEVRDGMIEDGTAIGMGLATAINRLRESEAKSKVIILLTDGVNNTGFIDPLTATDLAIQENVRVYTVGVGTKGMAPYPFKVGNRTVFQEVEVQIDEELLQKIAASTGGLYFRATNNQALKKVFNEIDMLEKSKIEVASVQRLSEEFLPFAILSALLLLAEVLLRWTIVKSIP
jgi:Ca-activated chloride channel family protein